MIAPAVLQLLSFIYVVQYLPDDRVLKGSMKDNFWEMGETGHIYVYSCSEFGSG